MLLKKGEPLLAVIALNDHAAVEVYLRETLSVVPAVPISNGPQLILKQLHASSGAC